MKSENRKHLKLLKNIQLKGTGYEKHKSRESAEYLKTQKTKALQKRYWSCNEPVLVTLFYIKTKDEPQMNTRDRVIHSYCTKI